MISKAVPARARSRTFAVGVNYITEHTHQRQAVAAGVTFEGGVTYASAPEKAEWVHLRGVLSVETASIEMEAVAALSSRCRDPVYHLIIAYAKHEQPTREQVVADAERLLKAVGMDDHQYVLAAHKDTDDFHAHVIANRVGPDGRANDLWRERILRERTCAQIAAERGWDIVVGHHNRDIVQEVERLHERPSPPEWRLGDGVYRRLHEQGELPWQDVARPYVLDAVDRAKDWNDLHERLAAHGVVVKLIQRGSRVQGLAFAEGHDRAAPGCAASRIDARCKLAALEQRFGPYMPTRERTPEVPRTEPWSDRVRPMILSAVDGAHSWDDLKQRLAEHDIVVKAVQRGSRVQGLAFSQGHDRDVPGCGASRIDARCKMAELEKRFGPFPGDERQKPTRPRDARHTTEPRPQERGHLRERSERDAANPDPGFALSEAGLIVDHARMRSAYAAYRDQFFAERKRAVEDRRATAWEREQAKRHLEAQRRRESRQMLRAIARLGTRGLVARSAAYWSIDAVLSTRRAQEHRAARARWEAMKTVLALERGRSRQLQPMDFRSFVMQSALVGDRGAQHVLHTLVPQPRKPRGMESERPPDNAPPKRATLAQVRARLDVFRAEEEARFQRAQTERRQMPHIAKPPSLDVALAVERKRMEQHVAEVTRFTDKERVELARLAAEQRSWNPLNRTTARRSEAALRDGQRSRHERALEKSIREFEKRDVPVLAKQTATADREYRNYAMASLAYEDTMRNTKVTLCDRLPQIAHQINVLKRSGIAHVDDFIADSDLKQLGAAVDAQYRAIPEPVRRDIEVAIRREQRDRERSRESIERDR